MNGAYIHLMLNHVPVLGSVFALLLLIYGMVRKNHSIANAALVTMVLSALMAVPVFLSGEEAEHLVDGMMGIQLDNIETHENHGAIAFWVMLMSGAIALGTLSTSIKAKHPSPALLWVNLFFYVVVVTLMIRTANSGGKIHHPEILSTATGSDFMKDNRMSAPFFN